PSGLAAKDFAPASCFQSSLRCRGWRRQLRRTVKRIGAREGSESIGDRGATQPPAHFHRNPPGRAYFGRLLCRSCSRNTQQRRSTSQGLGALVSASLRRRGFNFCCGAGAKVDGKNYKQINVWRVMCYPAQGHQVNPRVRARLDSEGGTQFKNILTTTS